MLRVNGRLNFGLTDSDDDAQRTARDKLLNLCDVEGASKDGHFVDSAIERLTDPKMRQVASVGFVGTNGTADHKWLEIHSHVAGERILAYQHTI